MTIKSSFGFSKLFITTTSGNPYLSSDLIEDIVHNLDGVGVGEKLIA